MSIKDRCEFLLTSQKWTDCSLVVGQEPKTETFKVHRLILGIASPVFEAMLLDEVAEGQDFFSLPDVQPETFRVLLKYIYCDHFNISEVNMAFDLCYVAKQYKLYDLVKKCTGVIIANMNPAIACKSLEFAKLIKEPRLFECSMQTIVVKTEEVLADPSIVDVSLDTWHRILNREDLGVKNECSLLTPLHNWAIKECDRKELKASNENMSSVVESVIKKIRFLSLTPQEYAAAPEVPLLLPPEKSNPILFNMVSSKSSYPMPDGYSMVTEKRGHLRQYCDIVDSQFIMVRRLLRPGFQSVLNISVSHAVRIYGILLEGEDNGNLTWGQLLNIEVRDNNGTEIASLGEGGDKMCAVFTNELIFHTPAEIEPHKRYRMILTFLLTSKLKSFNNRLLSTTCDGVTFTLSDGLETSRIVRTILFSRCKR